MTSATFSTSIEAQQAAVLLENYRFEMGNYEASQWVTLWLEFYRPSWIRDAVVEALYQGRYKSGSVRQILGLWHRRGQPIRHVTYEFEAAICREFGELRLAPAQPATAQPLRRSPKTNHNDASAAPQSFDLSAEATVPGMHSPESSEARAAAEVLADVEPAAPSAESIKADSDSTLRTQQQFRGVLYASARAIQPFKPSLPFSAQTLRLARQKILA